MADNSTLYHLVDTFCTTEQIKRLLRAGKARDALDVRVSAENKADLIDRNLVSAVDGGAIPLKDVQDLVRNGEENGRQHIYYYKVPKKLAATLTIEHVGTVLWGTHWKTAKTFPQFELKENDFVYADFRQWNPEKKPLDWALKIYGHELHDRFTGKVEVRGDHFYKEFVREDLRAVLLVRFNSPDLLEVRIQSDSSRRRMEMWESNVWAMLSKAVAKIQLSPWDLTKICAMLVESVEKHSSMYQLRDTRLLGTQGQRISFESHAPTGNLFAAIEMKDAVDNLISANSSCTDLAVIWSGSDGRPLEHDLSVLLGGKTGNQMIVSSACDAKDLDYVTQQLRFFSH